MKFFIARDENGRLHLFKHFPLYSYNEHGGYWYCLCYNAMEIPSNQLLEVTFENSPQEVELKLVEK